MPVAREAIEQLFDIGLQHFDVWMEEKAVPAAKQKAKKAGKIYLASFAVLSAFRDGKFIIDGERVPIERFIG